MVRKRPGGDPSSSNDTPQTRKRSRRPSSSALHPSPPLIPSRTPLEQNLEQMIGQLDIMTTTVSMWRSKLCSQFDRLERQIDRLHIDGHIAESTQHSDEHSGLTSAQGTEQVDFEDDIEDTAPPVSPDVPPTSASSRQRTPYERGLEQMYAQVERALHKLTTVVSMSLSELYSRLNRLERCMDRLEPHFGIARQDAAQAIQHSNQHSGVTSAQRDEQVGFEDDIEDTAQGSLTQSYQR